MTTVISVHFRGGCKTYYFDPRSLKIRTGTHVIVETAQGAEYAQCSRGNHEVEDSLVTQPLRPVLRIATDNDRRAVAYARFREKEAYEICQNKILSHGLDMKLVRAECSFDGNKILFFFTADGRVDFRELVKDLAGVFHSRIELRQIGVRDEAKLLGGLGICGRPFCCSAYMDDFIPVSIKMAKTQSLSLNPTKISGACGRLMCCLKYEQDAYEDAIKRLPKNDSFVLTPDGPGNVTEVNFVKETVTVRLDHLPESRRKYKGCEVQVLRSGKGSRDGIAVPSERPERYVVDPMDEFMGRPIVGETGDRTAEEKEPRHSRHRRGGHRGGEEAARGNVGRQPTEPEKSEKKEKSGAGGFQHRFRRPRRGGSEAKTAEPQAAKSSVSEAQNGAPHKRAGHRGGRRHGGRGGSAPKGTE